MDIKRKLKMYSGGEGTYASIATYILNSQDKKDININKISKECFLSTTTITRFCKKIGYSGFNEMKYDYFNMLKSENEKEMYETIDQSSSLLLRYTNNISQMCATLNNNLSQKTLNEVINNINTANQIILFSAGGSSIATLDFARKTARMGFNVFHSIDLHDQLFMAKNANKNSVCIAVSYSGETKEVIKCCKIASENGAKVIFISKKNTIPDYVDNYICIETEQKETRTLSTTSKIAALMVLDIICLEMTSSDNKYASKLKKTIYEE